MSVFNFIENHHLWAYFYIIAAVLFLVAVLILQGVLRFIRKRLKLYADIKKSGCAVYPTGRLWLLQTQRGKHCDFYFESGGAVYSVKLCGVIWTGIDYALTSRNVWLKQMNILMPGLYGTINLPLGYVKRKVPEYDFKYRLPAQFKGRDVIETLLFNPIPLSLTYNARKSGVVQVDIKPFDVVNGFTVIDGTELRRLLNNF